VAAAVEAATAAAAATEQARGKTTTAASVEVDEDERPINLAGFGSGSYTRGLGRGRPMGLQEEGGPFSAVHGRGYGIGRGRPLAPPPGLQGLNLSRSQRVPGGLSRSWMPGPPIPELEEADEGSTIEGSPSWPPWPDVRSRPPWPDEHGPDASWLPAQDLPRGALGTRPRFGAAAAAAHAADSPGLWPKGSYAGTPVDWGRTPSTLGSPPQSPALHGSTTPSAWIGQPGVIGSGDPMQPAIIPMYVTVPLAMAHSCPHCGNLFALPPGGLPEDDEVG